MTLEEGLWRSVQEWQLKSNFDRMIFYEMAEKFMEFEAEEKSEIQMLQQRNASVCLLPPAPRNLDPHGPSSTVVGQHPVFIPKKGGSMAQPPTQHQHRPQHPLEPKRSHETPPEAVKDYVEIMEDLLGTAHSATVEPDRKCEEEANEEQEEANELYPDPGLLSYIDKLCAQEAFITKVGRDLRIDSQVDPMSLRQELEEEEGLTLTQLVEKRLLELKGKVGVEAPPTYGVPTMESPCTESRTSQDAGSTDNHSIQLQMSEKMSTKELDTDDLPKDGSSYSNLSKSKELAPFMWSPMSQELKSEESTSPQRGPGCTSPRLGNRETLMSLQASPINGTPGKGERSGEEEEEEELPSLDLLLASQESLLPWSLSKSPLPASSILHHGVRGTWGESQPRSPETVSLSCPGHTAVKWKIPPQVRAPSLAAKQPYSGADLGVSGRQPLTVGLVEKLVMRDEGADPKSLQQEQSCEKTFILLSQQEWFLDGSV
ncbi:NUT family member 2D-like [Loxodonta africana]|uniref:NUT family member 2D-like n=1 Tax=Loxodonta africana TaxID=9785 RepID=UPI0030CF3C3D